MRDTCKMPNDQFLMSNALDIVNWILGIKEYMSYYHTYRPQQFSDLLGQEHVTKILKEALRSNRLVHAYLFAGSRGTGKTTTARLLAKAINCQTRNQKLETRDDNGEPCNECQFCRDITEGRCLDVIEIDAASNRGIDEIRELREQIRFTPQQAEKKVCIIDEVHMLTKEAFNALLKTLEEPPDYLFFILATTEPHKLPATIISRCQRFNFLVPDKYVIAKYLTKIASVEKLSYEAGGLSEIADLAQGSFRDATTLLEQLATHKEKISLDFVRASLGLPEVNLLDRFVARLGGTNDKELSTDIERYFSQNGNASAFIERAFSYMAEKLRVQEAVNRPAEVLQTLVRIKYQMKYSPIAELPILAAIGETPNTKNNPIESLSDNSEKVLVIDKVSVIKTQQSDSLATSTKDKVKKKDSDSKFVAPVTVAEQIPPLESQVHDLDIPWQQAITKLAEANQSSLVAILRTAKPVLWQPPNLKIGVQFKFHADQLLRQRNRAILESTFSEILGSPAQLETDILPVSDLASVAEEMFS